MPVSVTCPACGARLKLPDGASGRRFRCPKCQSPFSIADESGPPTDFEFGHNPAGSFTMSEDDCPFEGDGPSEEPGTTEEVPRRRGRKTTAKKPKGGYNPFVEGADATEPTPAPPSGKRRYRKDGDYNPFGDGPQDEVPDPVGEGFEFGIEVPPPAPAGEFDFGPLDPRGDDDGSGRRRR